MPSFLLGTATVSSAVSLPGLPEISANGSADVTLRFGNPALCAQNWLTHPDGAELSPDWVDVEFKCSADGAWFRLHYTYHDKFADFAISADGSDIVMQVSAGQDLVEVANLIEGPVLGRAVRLAGHPCLHATAVSVDGKGIAFMGPSGAGKSSIAWALVQTGCELLADDIVGISADSDLCMVHPGRSRIRLWPDAVARMNVCAKEHGALFPTAHEITKVGVCDPQVRRTRPARLLGVYSLQPRQTGQASSRVEEMPPHERLGELAGNLHGMISPPHAMRKRELALLAKIAAQVPVRRLTLPEDLENISSVAADLRDRLFA